MRSVHHSFPAFAAIAGVCLAGAIALPSQTAHACGGFFCDSSQPVNQQAERIIFSQNPNGEVTAVIQIQYQGPSERFAWMLPVAGRPEVSVSSNAVFDRIQAASNPSYRLNTTVEGMCAGDARTGGFGSAPPSASDGAADAGAAAPEDPGVTVVDEGSVGPYDYVIVAIDPEASDLVTVAIEWLQDNGYDVPATGSEVLRPYLESGMNLLAFRLTKGNDAGAIRPVQLSFGAGLPSIPLRPTAVAAQDDMGIMVWVLGPKRAVPANYRSLELNEALIDWLNPNRNYNDVVTRAANEAQGQGFVTEMAGDASPLGEVIWQDWEAELWEGIRGQDWTDREGELLDNVLQFGGLDGMLDVILAHIDPPEGVSEEEFRACPFCYVDRSPSDIADFEPEAFLAQVEADVILPIVETQALFEDSPYVTRLYTTMSAHEMTMDPVFDFNGDLPDISNAHTADRIIECSPSVERFAAPWRIELDDGQIIRGEGNNWPFATDAENMPANARIVRVGNAGEGEVVVDNVSAISAALEDHNRTVPPPGRTSFGCAVGVGSQTAASSALLALGLGLLAFRRRRR